MYPVEEVIRNIPNVANFGCKTKYFVHPNNL